MINLFPKERLWWNIGRYLASQSDRVIKLIVMGIPFGLAVSGDFCQFIKEFRAHWTPIVQAQLTIYSTSLPFQKMTKMCDNTWWWR